VFATSAPSHLAEDAASAPPLPASVRDFNRLFCDAAGELGFTLLAALNVSLTRERPSVTVLYGYGFEPWYARYEQMRYADHDCMIQELASATRPFFWSDVLARREISPESARMLSDACRFGLREGFLTPLQRTNEWAFVVMLAGPRHDCGNRDARTAAHLLCTCYGTLGNHSGRAQTGNNRPGTLTPRQKDCLKWVREGKSSTDIGAILGISAEVVDEHIQNACRRLGVRTRTQAAILVSDPS